MVISVLYICNKPEGDTRMTSLCSNIDAKQNVKKERASGRRMSRMPPFVTENTCTRTPDNTVYALWVLTHVATAWKHGGGRQGVGVGRNFK